MQICFYSSSNSTPSSNRISMRFPIWSIFISAGILTISFYNLLYDPIFFPFIACTPCSSWTWVVVWWKRRLNPKRTATGRTHESNQTIVYLRQVLVFPFSRKLVFVCRVVVIWRMVNRSITPSSVFSTARYFRRWPSSQWREKIPSLSLVALAKTSGHQQFFCCCSSLPRAMQ